MWCNISSMGGAGVLPVAVKDGEIYLLLSRERMLNSLDPDRGLWSDFGGGRKGKENAYQNAVREAYEESYGMIGSKKEIRDMIRDDLLGKINQTYVIKVDYDKDLPKKFYQNFKNIVSADPSRVMGKDCTMEKDKVRWIKLKNLKKNEKILRPWYRKRIPSIVNFFENLSL